MISQELAAQVLANIREITDNDVFLVAYNSARDAVKKVSGLCYPASIHQHTFRCKTELAR